MKSFKSLKWIAFVALAAVAYAAQDQILIRRAFQEGATEVYKIDSVVKQNIEAPGGAGEQDMIVNTSTTCSVKTVKVDAEKGVADVETVTKVEKATVDGSLAAMMGAQDPKLPEPKTEKGSMDSRNRFTLAKDEKVKGAGGMDIMAMMQGMTTPSASSILNLIELPEKPIKIGDSWSVSLPGGASMASAGVKDVKITVTLAGTKEVDGKTVYVVNTKGSFKLDFDSSKAPSSGQASPMGDFQMTGTADVSGEGLVDQATGKTLSNLIDVNNKATVHVEQLGADIPVKGNIKLTIKLQG